MTASVWSPGQPLRGTFAENIAIVDTDGNFTADNVEDALAEIAAGAFDPATGLPDMSGVDNKWLKCITGAASWQSLPLPDSAIAIVINPLDPTYGAVGDGATDDTSAIQAALLAASSLIDSSDWFVTTTAITVPRIVDFPGRSYYIAGELIWPNGIWIRGNNSTFIGLGGNAGSNTCLTTGYFSAGNLISNIGTAPETQRVQAAVCMGIKFRQFKQAFNLYNFNEGSAIRDCTFFDNYQDIYARRCFYAEFFNLISRAAVPLAAHAVPAMDFGTFVNQHMIERILISNRIAGMKISDGCYGQALRNVAVESGTDGIVFEGNVQGLDIKACYLEGLTGSGLDFSAGGGTIGLDIDSTWFANCGIGVEGTNMTNFRIGRDNRFSACTVNVDISDVVSTGKVEIPFARAASAADTRPPDITALYVLGDGVWCERPVQVYDSGSGATSVQQLTGVDLVPLPFSGRQGVQASSVPFCAHSKIIVAGVTFDVVVDTAIAYEAYTMYIFALSIQDNVATYEIRGRGYGNVNFLDTASGKTCVASNNGGFLRLRFSLFTHPATTYGISGIVRMV